MAINLSWVLLCQLSRHWMETETSCALSSLASAKAFGLPFHIGLALDYNKWGVCFPFLSLKHYGLPLKGNCMPGEQRLIRLWLQCSPLGKNCWNRACRFRSQPAFQQNWSKDSYLGSRQDQFLTGKLEKCHGWNQNLREALYCVKPLAHLSQVYTCYLAISGGPKWYQRNQDQTLQSMRTYPLETLWRETAWRETETGTEVTACLPFGEEKVTSVCKNVLLAPGSPIRQKRKGKNQPPFMHPFYTVSKPLYFILLIS